MNSRHLELPFACSVSEMLDSELLQVVRSPSMKKQQAFPVDSVSELMPGEQASCYFVLDLDPDCVVVVASRRLAERCSPVAHSDFVVHLSAHCLVLTWLSRLLSFALSDTVTHPFVFLSVDYCS